MSTTTTLHGPATAAPGQAEKPRLIHAVILLVTSGLTVLVTAVLGPSLPAMQAHFQSVPGADFLVPLTMTAPMLTMAVLSVFAGELADRFGRKRLLVCSTLVYAVVGTAPLYLDSLAAIIASRVMLGAMEAVLMTVSTTMIGDYYDDSRRDRYMSLQTTVAAVSAFLFNTLGGAIAEFGWRGPYAMFAASLLLAPLMIVYLWEPKSRASMTVSQVAEDSQSFRPGLLGFTCMLAVILGIVFLTVPVHFGFLHGAIGVTSPAKIGMAYGINSLGVILGTLVFGWLLAGHLVVGWQLGIGALISGTGFVLMGFADHYVALTTAGFVNGLGSGILLPAMVTWSMRQLPVSRRGFGIGAYQSCQFFGMFVSPVLVVGLEKQFAVSRAHAVSIEGIVLLSLAVMAILATVSRARRRGG